MSHVLVACSACRTKLSIPGPVAAERKFRCPKCSQVLSFSAPTAKVDAPAPAASANSVTLTLESIFAELRDRYSRGEKVRVEEYLTRHPDLRGQPEAMLDLVYNEILLLQQSGETPLLAEYQQRFPEIAEQLRMQFEVDAMLAGGMSSDSLGDDSASSMTSIRNEPGAGAETPPRFTPKRQAPTVSVPGYELMEILGRGGMGVVYKARHEALGRVVALKMIIGGAFASPEELARFKTEAAAIARLQHPHIVQIFEVGEVNHQPFFSLELVEGGSLAKRLNGAPCPSQPSAALMEKLARAVGYAHQRGIIHRDLKPANILLGRNSLADPAGQQSTIVQADTKAGVPSGTTATLVLSLDLVPKLTDFGLARVLDNPDGQTQTGAFLGTPSYAAPEQASGRIHDIGPHTDIYSLGAILYELLTGRPPFRGTSPLETLDLVRNQEPVAPRLLNPAIDVDLETICMKCLRKLPAERYLSAQDLADDLHRQQQGEPIRARPISAAQRVVKWAKRRPAVAAFAGLATFTAPILIAAIVSLLYQGELALAYNNVKSANDKLDGANRDLEASNRELKQQTSLATTQKQIAEKLAAEREQLNLKLDEKNRTIQRLLYSQDMSEGARVWRESRPARLGSLLERNRPDRTGGVDLRGFEWYYLNRLNQSERRTIPLSKPIRCVRFGSENDIIAVAGDDGLITFWDVTQPKDRQFLKMDGHRGSVRSFDLNHRFDMAVSGAHDGTVRLWEIDTPIRKHSFMAEGDFVEAVCFTPDSKHVAAVSWADEDAKGKQGAGHTSWLQIWNTDNRKEAGFVELAKAGIVLSIACRPDGKLLALGDYRGRIAFADLPGGKVRGDWQAHEVSATPQVRALAFSPDGHRLASASSDRTIKIWDVSKAPAEPAKLLHTLIGHTAPVTSVSFAADGLRLATGSEDATVRVWDVAKGKPIRLFKGHTAEVYSVAFAKKGDQLVSAGQDKTAKIWDSVAYQEGVLVDRHTHHLRAVTFTSDSKRFVAVGLDGFLYVRDAGTGVITAGFDQANSGYTSVAVSQDQKRLLTGGKDGSLRLWDLQTRKQAFALPGTSEIAAAVLLEDRQAVSASRDGKVTFWNLEDRKIVRTLKVSEHPLHCLACSRDGKRLAVGGADARVFVLDASTGEIVHTLIKHTDAISGIAFHPDGARLVTASHDGSARIWDVDTGNLALKLDGHETQIHSVAWSPDGKRIATGGYETIRVWDAQTGQETLSIRGHDQWIDALAFSPDSRRLASAGWDQTVRIWDGAERK